MNTKRDAAAAFAASTIRAGLSPEAEAFLTSKDHRHAHFGFNECRRLGLVYATREITPLGTRVRDATPGRMTDTMIRTLRDEAGA